MHALFYMPKGEPTYSTVAKCNLKQKNWPTKTLRIVISVRQILFKQTFKRCNLKRNVAIYLWKTAMQTSDIQTKTTINYPTPI